MRSQDIMIDSYRATPRCSIELRTILGSPLPAQLLEVRLQVGDEGCVAEADIELAGEVYARCRADGQLGLDAPGHGPGPRPAIDRPVRIALGLRPHLAELVAREPDPMKALLEMLLAPPAGLAHADAWRALDVTQLDPDQPELRMGYRTAWATADGDDQ